MVSEIALADAKANLSAVIKSVGEKGNEYIVTVRNKPSAMIVPIPKPAPASLKAAGALAGKRPNASREEEIKSYKESLEAKYANHA